MTLGVHSEVGRLRQVIVHRPGLELTRLTPQNISSLLFRPAAAAQPPVPPGQLVLGV